MFPAGQIAGEDLTGSRVSRPELSFFQPRFIHPQEEFSRGLPTSEHNPVDCWFAALQQSSDIVRSVVPHCVVVTIGDLAVPHHVPQAVPGGRQGFHLLLVLEDGARLLGEDCQDGFGGFSLELVWPGSLLVRSASSEAEGSSSDPPEGVAGVSVVLAGPVGGHRGHRACNYTARGDSQSTPPTTHPPSIKV